MSKNKRLLSLLLLFFFICFDKGVAKSSSEVKLPSYLRSAPKKIKSPTSKFEKEINEIDSLPIQRGIESSSMEDTGYEGFEKAHTDDIENIYSTHEKEQVLEEYESAKVRKASNLDRVFEQDDEIKIKNGFFEDFDEKNLVKNDREAKRERALINEVFGSGLEDEEMEKEEENLNPILTDNNKDYNNDSEMIDSYKEEKPDTSHSLMNQKRNVSNNPSTINGFKQGMYTFYKNCVLYSEPESSSEPVGLVKAGKEIWLDKFNDHWHKAYTKERSVYLKASCLQ